MYKTHYKPQELLQEIQPRQLRLAYGSAQRFECTPYQQTSFSTDNKEYCIVILKGALKCNHKGIDYIAGFKDALYIPRDHNVAVQALEPTIFMTYAAPSEQASTLTVVKYDDVLKDPKKCHVYGSKENNTERKVLNYLDDQFNASRLMVGVCEGSNGGWTAWPPHEHMAQREELYTYFDLKGGFAVQCVYEDMQNPLCVAMVTEGDLVSIPAGYHPNVSSPHSAITYVYVMIAKKAGEREFMNLSVQPEFGESFN